MPTFADTLREALTPLARSLLSHPFVTAIEAETLPRHVLDCFVAQDLRVVDAAGRALAAAAARADGEERLRLLRGATQEAEDRDRLLALAGALGLQDAQLAGAEPLAGCAALGHFLFRLCAIAPDPQRRAAFAALRAVFAFMARRIAAGLRSQYGLDAGAVAFFARHAEGAPEDPLEWTAAVAAEGVAEPVRRAILAGARQALAFEKLFFDTVLAGGGAAAHAPRAACLEHPFVRGIEAGTVPPAGLRLFAEQLFRRHREAIRAAGVALARTAEAGSHAAMVEAIRGAAARGEALRAFASAVGSHDSELETAEILPGAVALPDYLMWTAAFGQPGELAAADEATADLWAVIGPRLAATLTARYALPPAAAAALVTSGAGAGGARASAARPGPAPLLALQYERLFLDTLLRSVRTAR